MIFVHHTSKKLWSHLLVTFKCVHSIWASSWDYGTYHIGDQRRLRRACASVQSRQSLRCSHTWSMEVDEGSDKKNQTLSTSEWMHTRSKIEFRQDEKCQSHELAHMWSSASDLPLGTRGCLWYQRMSVIFYCGSSCNFHLFIWAASSEFVSSSIPSWQILTAHALPFRGARDLAFCLKVPLDSLLVWASSEGSGETARMPRLAWTFAARIGDKYQIRLTRPILFYFILMYFIYTLFWEGNTFSSTYHSTKRPSELI